ncbi:cell division protein FtsQ/DivIB [Candidatus Endowatersipora endosymbiont of Watersipora subatra]|uniref:cell division protein FtsQ/DivIB n=1 Tax=Candidatus Endowatersipora endosymbiont of Watersipora subatra TaxID=3077946 RepID=UPI00312C9E34
MLKSIDSSYLGNFISRCYRTFVRRSSRWFSHRSLFHKGNGTRLALIFLISCWSYGFILGDYLSLLLPRLISFLELEVKDIVISGQIETQEVDIINALRLEESKKNLGFDLISARRRVRSLPWIKDVILRKIYPSTLLVMISEYKAVAVWQTDKKMTIVRKSGDVITSFGISELHHHRFSYLPYLMGEGAAKTASEILPILNRYPCIANRAVTYQRIADRRWDVLLKNGLQILLPEQNCSRALAKIAHLQLLWSILDRDLDVIDARLAGRIILRLSPEVLAERREFVTDRSQKIRAAERNKDHHL